jgi:L-ribulose-5-phosphate 3-epimerase
MRTIGVTQWVLDREGPAAVARAAELGFGAIQLDAGRRGAHDVAEASTRRAYAAAAKAHGVTIAAIAARAVEDLGLREGLDVVRVAIDAAVELGAPLVYVPCFVRCEIRDADDLARAADVLRDACEHAGDAVLVGSENTLDAAGNRELLARVSHPQLRVLVDHYNAVLWGHDPLELVDAGLPHACGQMHCKDGRDGVMGSAPLGEGDGRFAETCKRLTETGFRGLVVCETDYRRDAERRAAHDLAALARHLDPTR